MPTLTNIYSDLDLTFKKLPGTNDVAMSYDDQAVVRSVMNLLLTRPFERPWQPIVGSKLYAMLFENISPLMGSTISKEIENTIQNYEPRAKVSKINVTPNYDGNGYDASVTFFIGNNTQPTVVGFFLERSR
jgi:phage baseplate assembly protein W